MVDQTTNMSFQLWSDGEEPWEHRTDFEKLDDLFSGNDTAIALTFEDNATAPSADGEIRMNASDVKVHSGGAVRNLTGPTFELLTLENTSTSPTSAGELRQNDTHVEIFSGGSARNVSLLEAKYTDEEAQDAVGSAVSTGLIYNDSVPSYTLNETVLKDGNAKELDAAELAGGLGTSGQVLTTDGSAASWGSSAGGAAQLTETDEIIVSLGA